MSTDAVVDRARLATDMKKAIQVIQRWSRRTVHRHTGTTLSPNEIQLLSHLADVPPQRMSALAQWQGVDRSTMSLQIRALVVRGLAQKVPDLTDRRATMIQPSPEGREALEQFMGQAAQFLEATVEEWADDDLTQFARYLSRFAEDLQSALAEDPVGRP